MIHLIFSRFGLWLPVALLVTGCVSLVDQALPSTLDILVVDGVITDLAEPQAIRLNRSKADPLTGRPGSRPVTGAKVTVLLDSSQPIDAHETEDGVYLLPNDFKGQIGHAYQLRFTLADGIQYRSTQQIMLAVPPISRVYTRFNATSLPQAIDGFFRAGHDFYLDTQDPAHEPNYYRWDWKLWEKQNWCRSCESSVYSVDKVLTKYSANGLAYFVAGDSLYEDCFYPPFGTPGLDTYFVYDYECRTQCWAIFASSTLNLFADTYTDGSSINGQPVAHIPYYQHAPCLVEIRQAALTPSAYQYYQQLANQTQKTGSLADSPPEFLAGNIHNVNNLQEGVFGYFTTSAVATTRYWLDRKDATGLPLGATDPGGYSGLAGAELFFALHGRQPHPEPSPPTVPPIQIIDNSRRSRPYTALCVSSDRQTPVKPAGWPNE